MKTYALFPNLALLEPASCADVQLIPWNNEQGPPSRALCVWEVQNSAEQNRADRQLAVLSGHLLLLCRLTGQPASACDYVKWTQAGAWPKVQPTGLPLAFAFLAGKLPEDMERTAATAVWFGQYLKEAGRQEKAIAIYNALGSLPCGFAGMKQAFSLPQEKELIAELIRFVKGLQQAEDDSGRPLLQLNIPDDQTLRMLGHCYLRLFLTYYPVLDWKNCGEGSKPEGQ